MLRAWLAQVGSEMEQVLENLPAQNGHNGHGGPNAAMSYSDSDADFGDDVDW